MVSGELGYEEQQDDGTKPRMRQQELAHVQPVGTCRHGAFGRRDHAISKQRGFCEMTM